MRQLILFLAFILFVSTASFSQTKKQPNIILMMADDLGWGDTGFNGNTIIKTPQLDKMADEGMVLTHFYSIGPVCSPTRASFLTGRHYYRMGVWSANIGHLPKEENTIAKMLKKEGYTTGHFGKWHLGTLSKTISAKGEKRKPEVNFAPPWERDYDESFVTESAVSTWNPGIGHRAYNNPYYYNGVAVTDAEKENVMGDDSRVLMDRAIPFIQNAVADNKPFLAVIWFHAPHEEVIAGPDYLNMYEGHGEAAHYYGCITAMDEQIGRLRSELMKLGIENNTSLFFCSDNGPEGKVPTDRMKTRRAGSAGEFSGRKRDVLDGGVRVPALAIIPGITKAGSTCNVPMSVLDYLPTVANLTNTIYPADRPMDGQDILPILQGQIEVHEKSIPFRYNNKSLGPNACLVKGKFKLIIVSKEDESLDMLYDLRTDIKEQNNVIEQHPEKAIQMRKEILEFLESAQKSHKGEDYQTEDFVPVDQWIQF